MGAVVIVGALAGMAADLDIIIRSDVNPRLYLTYHRQFTHSLFFIPIAAAILTYPLYFLIRRRLTAKQVFFFTTVGYATHALLDTCTSYGTQLLWPVTDTRYAWNSMSIIDPIFTFTLLALVVLAAWLKKRSLAIAGMVWVFTYIGFGFVQRDRAESILLQKITERGHTAIRHDVYPTIGNLVLWKTVYETDDRYFTDAVHVSVKNRFYEGESIEKLPASHQPHLQNSGLQRGDLQVFRWFSDQYNAVTAEEPDEIIDIRYSVLPASTEPLWVLRLYPDQPERHASFVHKRRVTKEKTDIFKKMLLGHDVKPPIQPPASTSANLTTSGKK